MESWSSLRATARRTVSCTTLRCAASSGTTRRSTSGRAAEVGVVGVDAGRLFRLVDVRARCEVGQAHLQLRRAWRPSMSFRADVLALGSEFSKALEPLVVAGLVALCSSQVFPAASLRGRALSLCSPVCSRSSLQRAALQEMLDLLSTSALERNDSLISNSYNKLPLAHYTHRPHLSRLRLPRELCRALRLGVDLSLLGPDRLEVGRLEVVRRDCGRVARASAREARERMDDAEREERGGRRGRGRGGEREEGTVRDAPSSSHSGLISMTCLAYSLDVMTSSNQRTSLGGGWCWKSDDEGWMWTVWFVLRAGERASASAPPGRREGEGTHLSVR